MSRNRVRRAGFLIAFGLALWPAVPARAIDWKLAAETDVVEILTLDADAAVRETKVWIVVDGEQAFVRTNDSAWLANIRRGSSTRLRVEGRESAVQVEEIADSPTQDRVEHAFVAKYGTMQRVMSALRWNQPTVLRLTSP